MDELLPVGSVVKLDKDAKLNVMIVGYYPVNTQTGVAYQYSGAVFPEGVFMDGNFLLFNHKDITKVLFRGYKPEENQE